MCPGSFRLAVRDIRSHLEVWTGALNQVEDYQDTFRPLNCNRMSASEDQSTKSVCRASELSAGNVESAWEHILRELGEKQNYRQSRRIIVLIYMNVGLAF